MALVVKNPSANAEDRRDTGSICGLRRSPGGRKLQPTPGFLPGKSHGRGAWRETVYGDSLWGHKGSDTAEATQHACGNHYHVTHACWFLRGVPSGK